MVGRSGPRPCGVFYTAAARAGIRRIESTVRHARTRKEPLHDRSRATLRDGAVGDVTQRNIWWTMLFTRLLMNNEDLRREFQGASELILLPEGDDELFQHDLMLYRSTRSERPVTHVAIAVRDSVVDVQALDAKRRRAYAIA